MTALGHCSHQVGGDRKLRGQPLVHSQRLGSLVWVTSCSFLVRNEQGLFSFAFCWCFLLTWAELRVHIAMGFYSSWTFISKHFFGFLHKYLQWTFGQLVIMFEIIGQVSKHFCK